MTQIWLQVKKKRFCVIPDCFGEDPIKLIADLKKQDKADGTTGGRYYLKNK